MTDQAAAWAAAWAAAAAWASAAATAEATAAEAEAEAAYLTGNKMNDLTIEELDEIKDAASIYSPSFLPVIAMARKSEERRLMLEKHEFAGGCVVDSGYHDVAFCAECGAHYDDVHEDDCELAALFKKENEG